MTTRKISKDKTWTCFDCYGRSDSEPRAIFIVQFSDPPSLGIQEGQRHVAAIYDPADLRALARDILDAIDDKEPTHDA